MDDQELPAGHVCSAEVAAAEFERFAEAMDIEVDPALLDEDDGKALARERGRLEAAICRGHLSIDETGRPVYTTKVGGEKLTFNEHTGAAFMQMDGKKKGHDVSKMFAVMASMTGRDVKFFAQMRGRDLKVCQTIVTLFLG